MPFLEPQPHLMEEWKLMFSKEYLLFRNGWDDESDKEIEDRMLRAASNAIWREQFLPSFVEVLKREQFIKIMECLDRDKNLDFNRGFVAGVDMVLNKLDRIHIKSGSRNHTQHHG